MPTKITREQLHAEGTRLFGWRWLKGNETAIHAATRLGIDPRTQEHKILLPMVVFYVMYTFLLDYSKVAKRPKINAKTDHSESDTGLAGKRAG